jgi:hypothetical protein
VNWIVSSGAQALATATPGTSSAGLFGLSPQATGALLFLGGASTMFGVAAGVGAFRDGKNNRPVSSPSS